jgi:hypothetical protein
VPDQPNLENGRPLSYDAAKAAAHRNHVHIAYDRGGWLRPGYTLAYNASGEPEWMQTEDEDV